MYKKLAVLIAVLVAAVALNPWLTGTAEAAAGDITMDVHGATVDHNGVGPGSTFLVEIGAESVQNVGGIQFDVTFDSTVVSVSTEPTLHSSLAANNCSFLSNASAVGQRSVAIACDTAISPGSATNIIVASMVFTATSPVVSTDTNINTVNPVLFDFTDPPAPITTAGTTQVVTIVVGICGDQNDDGVINVGDALIDLMIASGFITAPTAVQLVLSDVVRDGVIDTGDAVVVLEHIVGLTTITECGPPAS